MIVIFKNETDLREVKLRTPAFPACQFKVRSIMTGESIGTISGSQLQAVVNATLPREYKVQILGLRKYSSGTAPIGLSDGVPRAASKFVMLPIGEQDQ